MTRHRREWDWLGFLKVKSDGDTLVSDFVSVQKLIDYLCYSQSGSKGSLRLYLYQLACFCYWLETPPDELLSWDRGELEKKLKEYLMEVCKRSKEHGPSMRNVNTVLMCLKTFFRVNGFNKENNLELRVKCFRQPPRTRNRVEYVPKLSEACIMAERAKGRRNRAINKTAISTGLRNAALRGLNVGDIRKELEEGRENLLIKVAPEWNKRVPGACKNSIPYYTFTSHQATQAIKEMLEETKEKFGTIADTEPLFPSTRSKPHWKIRLSERELEEIVKNAAKEANIEEWRRVTPRSLRKVFESVLRSPLKDGGRMDGKDQEFLMGHVLPGVQENYYNWNDIEKLRSEFSKLVFEDEGSPELEDLKMYRKMAKILGINPDDVKKRSEEELNRMLSWEEEKKVLEGQIQLRLRYLKGDVKEQKVILKEELQKYLEDKWRFLGTIDSEHVVVEKVSVEPIAINPTMRTQTSSPDVSEENVTQQPTATNNVQVPSNAVVQKEKKRLGSKLHVSEPLAPTTQSVKLDNSSEANNVHITDSGQHGTQRVANSPKVEEQQHHPQNTPSLTGSTNTEEKKDVQNSTAKSMQKSLLDFSS